MENSSTSKLVMAFVLVIVGIALLAQIASMGLTVTSLDNTVETIDITAAVTNASFTENYTVTPVNNGTEIIFPSYGRELVSYSGMVVTNATDGVELSTAFVAANFSLNLTNGELVYLSGQSIYNDTALNFSVSWISYLVNESYEIIPTVVSEAATGWRSDISECAAGTIISGTYNNGTDDFTAVTDYIVDTTTGYITLVDNVDTNRTDLTSIVATNANCQDGYLTQGWQRNTINLVPGFFAIALLGVGIWLFYSIAKDTGVF